MATSVCLYLTEKCNLACPYCFVPDKTQESMDFQIGRAAIDLAFWCHYKPVPLNVAFFGGEPLLEQDMLKEMVCYSKVCSRKQGVETTFSLVTNGTLVSEPLADYLSENGFSVVVSLDGIGEYHDKNRPFKNGTPSFSRVRDGLLSLRARLTTDLLRVHACVTPQNVDGMAPLAEWLIQHGILAFALVPNYEEPWSDSDIEQYEKNLTRIGRASVTAGGRSCRIYPLHHFLIAPKRPRLHAMYMHRCLDDVLAVSIHGDVFPCHRFAAIDRYQRRYRIGEVTRKALDRRVLKEYYEARSRLLRSHGSMAGCPALNLRYNGTISEPLRVFRRFARVFAGVALKLGEGNASGSNERG